MARIAVVGWRGKNEPVTVDRLIAGFAAGTVVVSGGALGPDTGAEETARRHGLAVRIFRPDLEGAASQGQRTRRYHRRNQEIVDAADQLFALVAPNRRGGTEDTIRRARRKGIPVTLL